MKREKKLMIAALAGICAIMSSCKDHENNLPHSGNAVQFSSSIVKQTDASPAKSRVTGTNWEIGDAVGIYMLEQRSDNIVGGARNKQFTTLAGGPGATFNPVNGNDIYYPLTGDVKFTAYYPWRSDITDDLYPVDIKDQTAPVDIDLLWATADNGGTGYNKSNEESVPLAFEHKLTKLILRPSAGTGVDNLDGLAIEITGLYTTATFNLRTGDFGNHDGESETLIPQSVSTENGIEYEVILTPSPTGVGNNARVEFTIGTETFVWEIPQDTSFLEGMKHTWEITISRSEVTVTGSITDWEDETGGSDIAV